MAMWLCDKSMHMVLDVIKPDFAFKSALYLVEEIKVVKYIADTTSVIFSSCFWKDWEPWYGWVFKTSLERSCTSFLLEVQYLVQEGKRVEGGVVAMVEVFVGLISVWALVILQKPIFLCPARFQLDLLLLIPLGQE